MNKCGAKTRAGGKCKRPAGENTDHKGFGPCWRHGGHLPGPRKAAIKAEALAYAAEHYGTQDVQPTDALLMCVRDAAGSVAFYQDALSRVDADKLIENGKPHPWLVLRMEATDRCARYSQMALTAGVAERAVQLAERMGELLAHAAERMLDVLDLDAKTRARAVTEFTKAIAELESGAVIEHEPLLPKGSR